MQRAAATRAVVTAALLCLATAACAPRDGNRRPGTSEDPITAAEQAGPATAPSAEEPARTTLDTPLPPEESLEESVAAGADEDPCRTDDGRQGMLDRTQKTVYWTVCGATRWFDGFFGDRQRYDSTVRESYGRVGLGAFYDQSNGLDIDYRFRGSFALPAARERLENWQGKLKLGRGTDRELIEDRAIDEGDTLPGRFDEVEDANWLLGVGFRRGQKLNRGFDVDLGIRFRVPPDPYAKLRFFRNWDFNEDTLVRFRQIGFWTYERGFGTTSQVDLDKLLSTNLLARWSNSGTVAEDREGLDWSSTISFFQGLSNRRAFNYRLFIRGETGRRASLQNFGVDIGYRRRILREWLFVEVRASATFPQFSLAEERELNLGAGLFFDMYFGPVPEDQLR